MAKVFSVDAAINNNRPYIELRGRLYELADRTVEERLRRVTEFLKRQKEVAEAEGEENPEDVDFAAIQDVVAQAVQEALVDVPDEVAQSITEREFEVFQSAIRQAREMEIPVEAEDKDVDPQKVGRPVG